MIILEMPITDDAVKLHPRKATDYAAFKTAIRNRSNAVPVIKTRVVPGTDSFFDPIHLNGTGTALFAGRLAGQLAV